MQSNVAKEPAAPRPVRGTFTDIKGMSFEAALKELEQIVTKLERGDADLEQSIDIYERGEALRAQCAGQSIGHCAPRLRHRKRGLAPLNTHIRLPFRGRVLCFEFACSVASLH
jgi:exodeoxyribonuclease VII small subunit